MDCDDNHLARNEKTQPIQWTERPTGALVAAGSLWPRMSWRGRSGLEKARPRPQTPREQLCGIGSKIVKGSNSPLLWTVE